MPASTSSACVSAGACDSAAWSPARSLFRRRLFEHLDAHGLTICGDILIMPTFLNLDGEGSDIEVLYVPVEETAGA